MPLRVGDYLNPRIAALRRCDPELPRAMRGDSDDLGTAAVAQFPAPAVIIRKDSVFNRFGLALPALRPVDRGGRPPAGRGRVRRVSRGCRGGRRDRGEAAVRRHHRGEERGGAEPEDGDHGHARRGARRLVLSGAAGSPARTCVLPCSRQRPPPGRLLSASLPPTRAATRHGPRSPWSKDWNRLLWKNDAPGTLARLKTAMTPAELAAMLSLGGPAVTAAEVGDVLAAHPAFTRGGEDGFFISRHVRAITGGMQPQTRPPARSWAQRPAAPARLHPAAPAARGSVKARTTSGSALPTLNKTRSITSVLVSHALAHLQARSR